MTAKYLVLKIGRRSLNLVSMHPNGRLIEAKNSAVHTFSKTGQECIVVEVLAAYNSGKEEGNNVQG